jgi:hypothetical protein
MASNEINDVSLTSFYASEPVGHVEGAKPVHPRLPLNAAVSRPLPERSKKPKKNSTQESKPDEGEGSIIDDYA